MDSLRVADSSLLRLPIMLALSKVTGNATT
jgi:hypothetical protein